MIERGEFLEHARVFDHYYGTPRAPVEAALNAGRDMLFDIDWQGTQQLEEKGRDDLVTVFILPPSTRDLEKRLITRAQDAPSIVAQRMAKAADEMSHWAEYDYVIINRDIATSLIAAEVDPDRRAAEARAADRPGGFRQGAARGTLSGWRDAASGLRAQHELRRRVGAAGKFGDQPVAGRLDGVFQPAHESLLVEAGLDRRQELDGGAAGLLAPVAAVPQQADRGRDRRHRQAEVAVQVVDARAIALALARRHQVALGIDRDVAAAVAGALGELGEVLALLAAAAGVDADHLQAIEDGADQRIAEQLLHGDEGDAAGCRAASRMPSHLAVMLAGQQRGPVRGKISPAAHLDRHAADPAHAPDDGPRPAMQQRRAAAPASGSAPAGCRPAPASGGEDVEEER